MTHNLKKYKSDLDALISLGSKMFLDLHYQQLERKGKLDEKDEKIRKKVKDIFESEYQIWYNQAFSIIKYLLPDRLVEFEIFYKGEQKRKANNSTSFTIQDWLMGVRSTIDRWDEKKYFDEFAVVYMKFQMQRAILKSVEKKFESSLFNIKQLLQADLLDSEIDSSKELLKNGYLRASGVIVGVVLETHLLQVCNSHNISINKKNPTINDFNEILKKNDVIDVPNWRFVQRLGDLRNLCGHKREREPLKVEVEELINGVDKITKTIY